jgi:hypothetical protein
VFKIQIFHNESGFFMNTNHESDDLEQLKALLEQDAFAGPRFQIVDGDGVVQFGPITRQRKAPMSIEDLAKSFGVPVLDPRKEGYLDDESDG